MCWIASSFMIVLFLLSALGRYIGDVPFFSLLPITHLSPRLSSTPLLFSQLPWETVKTFLGGSNPKKSELCEVLVMLCCLVNKSSGKEAKA